MGVHMENPLCTTRPLSALEVVVEPRSSTMEITRSNMFWWADFEKLQHLQWGRGVGATIILTGQ